MTPEGDKPSVRIEHAAEVAGKRVGIVADWVYGCATEALAHIRQRAQGTKMGPTQEEDHEKHLDETGHTD